MSECNVESMGRAEENGGGGKPSKEVFPKEQAGKEMKEKRKKIYQQRSKCPPCICSSVNCDILPCCLSKEHIPTTTGRQILKSATPKTF